MSARHTSALAALVLLWVLAWVGQTSAAGDGGHDYTNTVVISIFGEVPIPVSQKEAVSCQLTACAKEPREAGQWMLATILRSMLKSDQDLSDKPPEVTVTVVPPFVYAPTGKRGEDQRSAFLRTQFRFSFGDLEKTTAVEVAENLCGDYHSKDEELLKGLLRSLVIHGLRPSQSLEIAARLGLTLNSVILMSSRVGTPTGDSIIGAGCNWEAQAKHGTDQGAFFLPPCPENSFHAKDPTDAVFGPSCVCGTGYHGEITLEWSEKSLPKYVGRCELVTGFCQGSYSMRLEAGGPALGVVGETALADCPEGYESTGSAQCIGSGVWSPSSLCRPVVPEPPPPAPTPVQVPCRRPGSANGTLDLSKCHPGATPEEGECIVSCQASFRNVGGGNSGGKFYCDGAGEYTGLPVCRPLCGKPDGQFGQLDTSACTLCVADALDCDCSLDCKGTRVGGGPEGRYMCTLVPGNDTVPARAVWTSKVNEYDREFGGSGGGGQQVPSCLPPIFITVVSATTKDGLPGVTVQVFIDTALVATKQTGASGQVELNMIDAEEVTVVTSLEGYATITRHFQRGKFCLDPTVNCGMQLSMSQVLKFGILNPNGCYFTASRATGEWDMRAVLEWTNDPKDLDIWARSLDCYESSAQRYGCRGKDPGRCTRYKFAEPGYKESEARACVVRQCLTRNCRTLFGRDGLPRCEAKRAKPNQFPKWVFWKARYSGRLNKRLIGPGTSPQESSVVQINPPSIGVVTLAGFVGGVKGYFCYVEACAALNGDYVERKGLPRDDQAFIVGGRETYWKGNDYFIYFCQGDSTWRVTESRAFQQVSQGICKAFARSEANADILSPSKISFPELWDAGEKSFQTRTGAHVARLHLLDASEKYFWTDDHFLFLNVDHRTGYGPETVTFRNVPPGTYQVAVNTYSRNDINKNINGGKPIVSIYVGGDQRATFECEIKPECNNASKVWNVVNIQISDGGEDEEEPGKNRYYLRLMDTFETLQGLREVDLPTSDRLDPGPQEVEKYQAPKDSKYFYLTPSQNYDDQQLRYVCYGRCRPAPGYEQCILQPPP